MEHWPTRRVVLITLTVGIVLYLVYYVPGAIGHFVGRIWDVLVILAAAAAMAILLGPAVRAIAGLPLPLAARPRRVISALVVYAAILWALWVGASFTSTQLIAEAQHISELSRDWLVQTPGIVQQWLSDHARELPAEVVTGATSLVAGWTSSLLEYQFGFAKGALGHGWYLVELFVVPVLAFYFLVDGVALRLSFNEFVPARFRDLAGRAVDDIGLMLHGFVRAQAVICVIYGLVVGLALWLLGVRMYLSLAVIAALFRMAPVVGPWVAGALCVGVPLLQEGSQTGLVFLAIYALLVIVDGKLLTPILLAGGALLHPVAAILSLLVGYEFLGVIGLLLAVPVAGAIRVILLYYREFAQELQAGSAALEEGPASS